MSIIALFLIFSMLYVMYTDVTRYTIANWLVGLLLIAYPVAVYLCQEPIDWKMALAGALIVLVVGYFLFAMKWVGAGDIKLLFACALWIGWEHLPEYVMLVAILGGVFAGLLYIGRKMTPMLPFNNLPRIMQEGAPVAYGVAIAAGFLWMMEKKDGFITTLIVGPG